MPMWLRPCSATKLKVSCLGEVSTLAVFLTSVALLTAAITEAINLILLSLLQGKRSQTRNALMTSPPMARPMTT